MWIRSQAKVLQNMRKGTIINELHEVYINNMGAVFKKLVKYE